MLLFAFAVFVVHTLHCLYCAPFGITDTLTSSHSEQRSAVCCLQTAPEQQPTKCFCGVSECAWEPNSELIFRHLYQEHPQQFRVRCSKTKTRALGSPWSCRFVLVKSWKVALVEAHLGRVVIVSMMTQLNGGYFAPL